MITYQIFTFSNSVITLYYDRSRGSQSTNHILNPNSKP